MLIYDGKEYRKVTAEEEVQYQNLFPEPPIPEPIAEEILDILTGGEVALWQLVN